MFFFLNDKVIAQIFSSVTEQHLHQNNTHTEPWHYEMFLF